MAPWYRVRIRFVEGRNGQPAVGPGPGLAFADNAELMNATRVGVIGGSVISAIIGAWLMRRATIGQERGGPVDIVHEGGAERIA